MADTVININIDIIDVQVDKMDIVLIPLSTCPPGIDLLTTNNGTHGEKIMACILALETKQCKILEKQGSLSVAKKGDPET